MAASAYTTIQGDAWDAVAYRLWGEERLAHHLMRANPEHMDVLVFPAGVELAIPAVREPLKHMETPEWMR